jgi:hypothetical protein
VRAVEEHDGSGVTGLEELSVRGRLNGVPRPRAAGSCRHLQPRPSPSSSGLRRQPREEAVRSVQRQGWRRVVAGGAPPGGSHRQSAELQSMCCWRLALLPLPRHLRVAAISATQVSCISVPQRGASEQLINCRGKIEKLNALFRNPFSWSTFVLQVQANSYNS